MFYKYQEDALNTLLKAKEEDILAPDIVEGLRQLIATYSRPKLWGALEKVSTQQLKPDEQAELISILEKRFGSQISHYKRPEGVDFNEVKTALERHPELMVSLAKMEITGGAPDIIIVGENVFIFGDCSAESPSRRYGLNYDKAVEMANEFGVDIMPRDTYCAMQKLGRFDMHSWNWLETPPNKEKIRRAFVGTRLGGRVQINRYSFNEFGSWRGVLRFPRAK